MTVLICRADAGLFFLTVAIVKGLGVEGRRERILCWTQLQNESFNDNGKGEIIYICLRTLFHNVWDILNISTNQVLQMKNKGIGIKERRINIKNKGVKILAKDKRSRLGM